MEEQIHPAQFQFPIPVLSSKYSPIIPAAPLKEEELSKYKIVGKKIKQAFVISILFVLFVNSFVVLDKINFVFTHRNFDFITEDTNLPTIKGYLVSSAIFFILVVAIILQ